MPLWSFPGVVTDHTETPGTFGAELDLGCRWYLPTPIRVAGLGARSKTRLPELLPAGTRFTAYTNRLDKQDLVRAHIILSDGRDVASTAKGTKQPVPPVADFGGTLGKVWRYPAIIRRLCDADTAELQVDLGVPTRWVTDERVSHIDAPEKNTAEGQAAIVWAERVLTPGLQVLCTSHGLDKYKRLLGTLTLPDGRDYATELATAGHAKPYEGGKR